MVPTAAPIAGSLQRESTGWLGLSMKAWITTGTAGGLELTDRPVPVPGSDEVLLSVQACGICRTDLHVIDQELPARRSGVIPGHQIVGTVVQRGDEVHHLHTGDRVGAAWLRRTCGICQWCRGGCENLCPDSQYTGWDADGGYAQFAVVPGTFAYPLSASADPVDTAPLLCAGIIGYRALTRANLPPGGRLGIYGFGSSAHLTAQLAMAQGAAIYAMTRGEGNRDLARRTGAVFVGDTMSRPPVSLDSAIVFAPVGALVPLALEATTRGGTVVTAGIHMTDIPTMSYTDHLFHERDLRSVTANTRGDGIAFLRLAATLRIAPSVTRYSFEHLDKAIDQLRHSAVPGSLVVAMED